MKKTIAGSSWSQFGVPTLKRLGIAVGLGVALVAAGWVGPAVAQDASAPQVTTSGLKQEQRRANGLLTESLTYYNHAADQLTRAQSQGNPPVLLQTGDRDAAFGLVQLLKGKDILRGHPERIGSLQGWWFPSSVRDNLTADYKVLINQILDAEEKEKATARIYGLTLKGLGLPSMAGDLVTLMDAATTSAAAQQKIKDIINNVQTSADLNTTITAPTTPPSTGGGIPISNGNVQTAPNGEHYITDATGNHVLTDAAGNPVMSPTGQKIYVAPNGDNYVLGPNGEHILVDARGNPILGPNGEKIYVASNGEHYVLGPNGEHILVGANGAPVTGPDGKQVVLGPNGEHTSAGGGGGAMTGGGNPGTTTGGGMPMGGPPKTLRELGVPASVLATFDPIWADPSLKYDGKRLGPKYITVYSGGKGQALHSETEEYKDFTFNASDSPDEMKRKITDGQIEKGRTRNWDLSIDPNQTGKEAQKITVDFELKHNADAAPGSYSVDSWVVVLPDGTRANMGGGGDKVTYQFDHEGSHTVEAHGKTDWGNPFVVSQQLDVKF